MDKELEILCNSIPKENYKLHNLINETISSMKNTDDIYENNNIALSTENANKNKDFHFDMNAYILKETRKNKVEILKNSLKLNIIEKYNKDVSSRLFEKPLHNKNLICLFIADLYTSANNSLINGLFYTELLDIFCNATSYYVCRFIDIVKPSLKFPCEFINHIPVDIVALDDSQFLKDFSVAILKYVCQISKKASATDYDLIRRFYECHTSRFNRMVREMFLLAMNDKYKIDSLDDYYATELTFLIKSTTVIRSPTITDLYKRKIEGINIFEKEKGSMINFKTLENSFMNTQKFIRDLYKLRESNSEISESLTNKTNDLIDSAVDASFKILNKQISYIEKVNAKSKESEKIDLNVF